MTVIKFSISATQDMKDYLDTLSDISDIDISVIKDEVIIIHT